MSEKLQKIISACGIMSRRSAEQAILQGRVTVNGQPAALGDRADAETDIICVDGVRAQPGQRQIYVAVNKPKGYVTTMSDEKGRKNVTELVSDIPERLYPVGRLDINSEGLLIMTNDGDFANKVMHPSNEKEKVYLVFVKGDINAAKEKLTQPMVIDGYTIKPAKLGNVHINPAGGSFELTIHEGRNRQVRKMCQQTGLLVTNLRRIAIGPVSLGKLPLGKWRELTGTEVEMLISNE